jgi:hypothetical protein
MFFLGLDGFSDEQSKAIKATCIKVIPLKKIVARITPWRLVSLAYRQCIALLGWFGPRAVWTSVEPSNPLD